MSNGEKQNKKKFGINIFDRFSQIDQTYLRKKFIEINPKLLESISLIKIEFTKFSTVVLLSNGRVITKGSNLLGREPINEKHKKIFDYVEFEKQSHENAKNKIVIYDISSGDDYVLALDNNYHLWGWGSNAKKQLDSTCDIVEFIKPKKLSYINENCSFSQIFAFSEGSIAVSKDNKIKVWGEKKNSILGKNKVTADKNNFIEKTSLSKYIEKELLKDDSDITESFVKTRKIFNTKYLEDIKIEKKTDESEKIYTVENENEVEINTNKKTLIDSGNKLNDSIKILEDRIKEYDVGLDDVNSKKDSLRIKIKVIDDQINQYKIDQEKILKKLFSIRKKENNHSNVEESEYNNQDLNPYFKEKSEANDQIQNESYNKSFKNINPNHTNSSVNKSHRDLKNFRIHEETLQITIEKLIGLLDEKKTERNIISNEIEKLVEKENLFFQNKMVLIDMINLLKKYGLKPESELNSWNKYDKKDEFDELISYLKNIEDNTYLNLFEKDKIVGSHKSAEIILKESRNEVEKIKNSFEKYFGNSAEEQKNKSFKTLKKLIDHKFNMIAEQNNMINCLINYFHCIPDEVLTQLTNKQSEPKVEDKKKNMFKNLIDARNKQTGKREEICRDMIVSFLKESQTVEIKNNNEFKKNKFSLIDKNKIYSVKDESVNNINYFSKYVTDLNMGDLVILSKYNDSE